MIEPIRGQLGAFVTRYVALRYDELPWTSYEASPAARRAAPKPAAAGRERRIGFGAVTCLLASSRWSEPLRISQGKAGRSRTSAKWRNPTAYRSLTLGLAAAAGR